MDSGPSTSSTCVTLFAFKLQFTENPLAFNFLDSDVEAVDPDHVPRLTLFLRGTSADIH